MNLADFLQQIKSSPVELMGVIYHNTTGVAGFKIVGEGTADSCSFSSKAIVAGINEFRSPMLTLVHNHPQGEVRPSADDLTATFGLQDYLKKSGVTIRDHLILGGKGGTYSFKEHGVI